MQIPFDKMQGLGNDFVFIDWTKYKENPERKDVIKICDRKLGIGCDTLVLYKQKKGKTYHLYFFNQDGSEAEICVNAARCFALLMQKKRSHLELSLSSSTKNFETKIVDDKIFVNIGQPSFSHTDLGLSDVSVNTEDLLYDLKLTNEEISYFDKACAISVGNPHLILFLKKDITTEIQRHIGNKLECFSLFKNRINVSFAQIINNQEIRLHVYERGVGFTEACGSGACATAFMAFKLKLVDKKIRIKQPGGDLEIFIKEDNSIIQKGPATYVFKGEIEFSNRIKSLETYQIYTDGACSGNPGPGGWGAVILKGEKETSLKGGNSLTTNNKMELTAPIEALKTIPEGAKVEIFTDSTYVKNGITSWINTWKKNGWVTSTRTPVKNQELWMTLDDQIKNHQVIWHWIKGHNGHKHNEKADQLARNACDDIQKQIK